MGSAARATRDKSWLARAIERYHELCANRALAGPQVAAAFAAAQVAQGLTFGGTIQCRSLRPAFITEEDVSALRVAVRDFWSCIGVLERRTLGDPQLAVRLGLSERERALISIDPGYEGATAVSRVDTFFTERPAIIEYNADSPAGMSYQAGQAALVRQLPVFERFAAEFDLEELRADIALRETLAQVWDEYCASRRQPTRPPTVAIVDLASAATSSEFSLVANDLEAHGMPALVATLEDLRYESGELRACGRRVDLVYKRLLVADFLARYDLGHPLIRAYADGAVCIASSFRCTIGQKKRALAELCEERNAGWFSEPQLASIARLVARTWLVSEFEPARLASQREHLVLKPNDAHGGENVFLGWECDERSWSEACALAAEGDYVVQERAAAPSGVYPIFDPGAPEDGARLMPIIEDRNAYVFRGQLGGILTRLSQTGIINVSRGGQAIPTFVIRPR